MINDTSQRIIGVVGHLTTRTTLLQLFSESVENFFNIAQHGHTYGKS